MLQPTCWCKFNGLNRLTSTRLYVAKSLWLFSFNLHVAYSPCGPFVIKGGEKNKITITCQIDVQNYKGSISQTPNIGVSSQSAPYQSPFTMLVPTWGKIIWKPWKTGQLLQKSRLTAKKVHCCPDAGTPLNLRNVGWQTMFISGSRNSSPTEIPSTTNKWPWKDLDLNLFLLISFIRPMSGIIFTWSTFSKKKHFHILPIGELRRVCIKVLDIWSCVDPRINPAVPTLTCLQAERKFLRRK